MTMLTLDKPITMRMSKQDAEKLKSIARNNYCTVSTYCRLIIKREIDKLNQSELGNCWSYLLTTKGFKV